MPTLTYPLHNRQRGCVRVLIVLVDANTPMDGNVSSILINLTPWLEDNRPKYATFSEEDDAAFGAVSGSLTYMFLQSK